MVRCVCVCKHSSLVMAFGKECWQLRCKHLFDHLEFSQHTYECQEADIYFEMYLSKFPFILLAGRVCYCSLSLVFVHCINVMRESKYKVYPFHYFSLPKL